MRSEFNEHLHAIRGCRTWCLSIVATVAFRIASFWKAVAIARFLQGRKALASPATLAAEKCHGGSAQPHLRSRRRHHRRIHHLVHALSLESDLVGDTRVQSVRYFVLKSSFRFKLLLCSLYIFLGGNCHILPRVPLHQAVPHTRGFARTFPTPSV